MSVKPRILIIGKNGQVGWELCRSMAALGDVVAIDFPEIDLSNGDSIRTAIRAARPGVIINAAAYTAVDKVESELEKATAINGVAPGIIAEEAKRLGAVIVHYSTDYVFDGSKTTPYTEGDVASPLNAYGKTKLMGDEAIKASDVPHLIFRTSWVYGWRGSNFLLTMLRLFREREEIRVIDDQIGTPNWSRFLAETTAQVLAQGSADMRSFVGGCSGIYNMTLAGSTSWYGFAKAIHDADPNAAEYQVKRIVPISSDEYGPQDPRPAFSVLDSSKLAKAFDIQMPLWTKPLALWAEKKDSVDG